jgi:phospholipase C
VPSGKSFARFYAELNQSTVAATVRFDDASLLFNYAQGGFTYVPQAQAPTVSSIEPSTGSTSGGTRLIITGTGFLSGAVVALGTQPATNVAVVNSTTITAVAPAHAAGAVTVSVTNTNNQVGTLPNGYTYAAPSGSSKVFLLVAENHSYQNVVGSTAMPYLNSLIPQYGLATQYFADSHPSIPNYFMLTTGQVLTIDDKFPGTIPDDNLVRHIVAAGKTWKSYAESLPSVGYIGNDVPPYVKRHNPFAYFTDVTNNSTQKMNLVPFSQFASDMANSQLPDFSFIVPNVNNDAHDCPAGMSTCTDSQKLAALDTWLQTNINPLITSAAFQMNGTLIIVFDESFGSDVANGGGQVAMLVISSQAKPGFRSITFYQHENTLKLLSKTLGLSSPGAAAMASDMAEFFTNATPVIPPVTSSPTSIFFGDQLPGTNSSAHPVLLRNNQSGNLTITSLATSGDFAETDNCPRSPNPVSPGASCTINVTFAPTTTRGRTGMITINDGAPTTPQRLYLSGNGAAAVLSPTSLVFGNQALGSNSMAQAVTLTNTQSTPVTISNIATAGDFSQTNNCGSTLGAGLFCTLNVIFTPTSAGTRSGTLTVTDSAGNSPQITMLTGAGVSAVTLNPSSMTFNNQALNTNSAPAAALLTNNQAVNLNISSIVTSGDFAQSNNCPAVLIPQANCTIQITFRPTATGSRTGAVTVSDDAPGTPQKVSLAGVGVTSTTVVGPCPLSSASPSVTICSPGSGLAVDSPVRVIAGTKDSNTITQLQIQVDGGTPIYTVLNSATLDTGVSLPLGTHQITVAATDSTATVFNSTTSVNVVAITPTCPLSTTNPSVTICTPENGTTITSPLHVVAGTTDSSAVSSMQILVDGVLVYSVKQGLVDTYIPLSVGNHTLVVQAQDSASKVFSDTALVTVGDLSKISHIIWFLQENRSFDNYFGRMGQYRRDHGISEPIDDLPLNVALPTAWSNPQFINPFHFVTYCHEAVSSEWNMVHVAYNNGKMDSFMRDHSGTTIDPFNTRDIGYYDWTDLPPYYFLALNYGTSDRYFSSMLGQTDPNRMYTFAATSFGHILAATPPAGGWTQTTIFDQLDKAGISWRYYYQSSNVIDLQRWSTWTRDSGKVVPIANYYNDIKNESSLPKVIFIERSSSLDEHTGNNIQKGAANSTNIINALMQSPSWASSVFILTFDEGGGMYDHVVPAPVVKPDNIGPSAPSPYVPAPGDFGQSGQRVPFFILSPYLRPHYLSHTVREHGSILKLIERRFGLPALTFRDAAADDMSEFFDFTSPQLLTPPALPTQPTGGLCDFNSEKAPNF